MKFTVVVYDRVVRHLEKVFEADSEEKVRELAEDEEWTPDNGWTERYEELFSENCIERVEAEQGEEVEEPEA
jgi:hypothetical protein